MITHSSTRCVWRKSYPARPACSERHDKGNLCQLLKVRQNNMVGKIMSIQANATNTGLLWLKVCHIEHVPHTYQHKAAIQSSPDEAQIASHADSLCHIL